MQHDVQHVLDSRRLQINACIHNNILPSDTTGGSRAQEHYEVSCILGINTAASQRSSVSNFLEQLKQGRVILNGLIVFFLGITCTSNYLSNLNSITPIDRT